MYIHTLNITKIMSTSRDNERSTKSRSFRLSLVFEEEDDDYEDDVKIDNAGDDAPDAALEDVFDEEGIELAWEAIESVVEKFFEDANELKGVPAASDQKVLLMGDDSDNPVKKLLQEILDIANETKDENEHNAIVKKLEALKSELLGVPIPMAPSAAPPPPPPPLPPPPPPPTPAKVQLRKKKIGNSGIRISKVDVKGGTYVHSIM